MSDDDKKSYIRVIIEFIIKFPFSYPKWFLLLCLLLFGLIGLYFYQETCSDYQCPNGYVKNESKKDTECDSLTCDSVDRDTCCNSKQKCSEYTCPTGYEGKDNSDNIYCKDSVCKESDDKDTCCNKSVNCEGSWSDFSECSVECGEGTQTRAYTVTKQPQYGGTPCPTTPESRSCNTQACEPNQDGGANDVGAVVSTDTELPICSQVAVPNKIAEGGFGAVPADNLQVCSGLCATLGASCQSFAYSDIDQAGLGPSRNCIVSESIGSIEPYGVFINEGYLSWSFYPKCRVS